MRPDEEFAPLRIIKKNLTDFDRCAYRVYKSHSEYVTVEAATALEAFRESGIKSPLRILRETRFMDRLVNQDKFNEVEEVIETSFVMEPPMAITGHQEPVPQAQPRAAMQEPVAQPQPAPAFEAQSAEQITAKPSAPEPAPAPAQMAEPAAEEAEPVSVGDELSEDDVAKLLGDGE